MDTPYEPGQSKDRNGGTRLRRGQVRTRLTLLPGQNGTRKMVDKYGQKLVAVRYRYDAEQRRRFKTVELIEEILPWAPPVTAAPPGPVYLSIGYEELAVRQAVKEAGGKWDPQRRLWQLDGHQAHALGLSTRIVNAAQ